jgi:hypothetical protein
LFGGEKKESRGDEEERERILLKIIRTREEKRKFD